MIDFFSESYTVDLGGPVILVVKRLYCYVVCIVPTAPVDFLNVSRTATSVSFSWISPTEVNGILQDYRVRFLKHDAWHESTVNAVAILSLCVCSSLMLPVMDLYRIQESIGRKLSKEF